MFLRHYKPSTSKNGENHTPTSSLYVQMSTYQAACPVIQGFARDLAWHTRNTDIWVNDINFYKEANTKENKNDQKTAK